jgi:hypothetical protein
MPNQQRPIAATPAVELGSNGMIEIVTEGVRRNSLLHNEPSILTEQHIFPFFGVFPSEGN